MHFEPAVMPPASSNDAYWFIVSSNDILVTDRDSTIPIFANADSVSALVANVHYLGTIDSRHAFCAELASKENVPKAYHFNELRSLFGKLSPELFMVAGRAMQILNWDRTHRFCGQCGSPTQESHDEYARICNSCGMLWYPRVSPAVIVAIVKEGRELLMARRVGSTVFSVIAGYVETAETLEDTVRREAFEEAGVEIRNISYFSSQPWPFSSSIMVGFTADYAGGEIRPDGHEIEEVRWFARDSIPQSIPGQLSIARRLIEWFVASGTHA